MDLDRASSNGLGVGKVDVVGCTGHVVIDHSVRGQAEDLDPELVDATAAGMVAVSHGEDHPESGGAVDCACAADLGPGAGHHQHPGGRTVEVEAAGVEVELDLAL